eukprot:9085505-Alexandrium_andersonii.AAC.1
MPAGAVTIGEQDFNLMIVSDPAFSDSQAAMSIPAWNVKAIKPPKKVSKVQATMLMHARDIVVAVPEQVLGQAKDVRIAVRYIKPQPSFCKTGVVELKRFLEAWELRAPKPQPETPNPNGDGKNGDGEDAEDSEEEEEDDVWAVPGLKAHMGHALHGAFGGWRWLQSCFAPSMPTQSPSCVRSVGDCGVGWGCRERTALLC